MGYVPTRTTYKLVFENPEYNGLEVATKAGRLGDYMEIAKLANVDWAPPYTLEQLDQVDELLRTFAGDPKDRKNYPGVLVSWNIEDPKPIPANLAGLKSLDLKLAMAIIVAWMNAAAGEAVPLDQDGDLEAGLPMDVAS